MTNGFFFSLVLNITLMKHVRPLGSSVSRLYSDIGPFRSVKRKERELVDDAQSHH